MLTGHLLLLIILTPVFDVPVIEPSDFVQFGLTCLKNWIPLSGIWYLTYGAFPSVWFDLLKANGGSTCKTQWKVKNYGMASGQITSQYLLITS